jgi:hypothetical protein
MQMPGKGSNVLLFIVPGPRQELFWNYCFPMKWVQEFKCVFKASHLILLSVCAESVGWYSEQNLFWRWLTLFLSDGSNQVGVSWPFSPENKQQIQFPRHTLFRIPQCTEFTNPVTLHTLLSESFRTEVNITLCSLLRYFLIAGDNISVFSVKKFSMAYTFTITFIYNVLNFQFNWSQANLTVKFNTSNIFLKIMFIHNFFILKKNSNHGSNILYQLVVTCSSHL